MDVSPEDAQRVIAEERRAREAACMAAIADALRAQRCRLQVVQILVNGQPADLRIEAKAE